MTKKWAFQTNTTKPPKLWNKEKVGKDTVNPNLAELRAAGKCFKCREPWVPDHGKVCKAKQAFSMILVENDEGKEEVVVVEDGSTSEEGEFHDAQQLHTITIFMHALCGAPPTVNTFTLRMQVGNQTAIALVDSGSEGTFINAKFAANAKCKISAVPAIKVAAANGTQMISESACVACPYSIQGQSFVSDFRLLEVQGYDIILGADCI